MTSFSFLFRRKEKQKEAKRKEKPDKKIKERLIRSFQSVEKVAFSHFFDILKGVA